LLATLAYPTITVLVNISATATSPQSNVAKVTGGGSASTSTSDVTVINTTAPSNPPILSIALTHTGNFTQGQQGATYTITVGNKGGASSTSGTVYANLILPVGLTAVSMSGTGWTCSIDSCSRVDALGGGSSYPTITATVNVAANAPASVTTDAVALGGGSPGAVTSNATTIQAK
jgi:hypothetical protein